MKIVKISLTASLLAFYGNQAFAKTQNPQDPLEPLNRRVFQFNYELDKVLYRPVAKFYLKITPPTLQKAVRNFFNNIDEIPSVINDFLQLDGYHAVVNTWRFVINSTIGVFGTMDIASRVGLLPYKNDFGLTLYKWGIRKSPYLQIVFLGPSTIRDTAGMCIGYSLTSLSYLTSNVWVYGVNAFRGVPARAQLIAADKLVDDALDPYIFVREAYLQNRQETIKKMASKNANE